MSPLNFCPSLLPLIDLSLSERLGLSAQPRLHPRQRRGSQRSGRRGPDGEAVGVGPGLLPENVGRFTGGSGGHGAEEVAGTRGAGRESRQSEQ